ncbi:hypothetical protein ACFX1S_003374 [Malus domestica]
MPSSTPVDHCLRQMPHQEIDLLKIVKRFFGSETGLWARAQSLQDAFDLAIRSHDYGSHYQGVYPMKCNQDRFVVEDIVKFGSPFRFRLEVESKPELTPYGNSHVCTDRRVCRIIARPCCREMVFGAGAPTPRPPIHCAP